MCELGKIIILLSFLETSLGYQIFRKVIHTCILSSISSFIFFQINILSQSPGTGQSTREPRKPVEQHKVSACLIDTRP